MQIKTSSLPIKLARNKTDTIQVLVGLGLNRHFLFLNTPGLKFKEAT